MKKSLIILISVLTVLCVALTIFAGVALFRSRRPSEPEENALALETTVTTFPWEAAPTQRETQPTEPEATEETTEATEATVSIRETEQPTVPAPAVSEKPQEQEISGYRESEKTLYATDIVNVRTGDDLNHHVIGQLTPGTSVRQLAVSSSGWSRISYQGREAYVSSRYLTETRPRQPAPKPAEKEPVFKDTNDTVYSTGSVNVRSGPGTGHKAIGYLKPGNSAVRVAESDNGWSKIQYNSSYGYVSSRYLTTKKPESSKPESAGPKFEPVKEEVTATDSIHVRSGPGTGYKKIGYLKPGQKAVRVGIGDNGWSKILYEGKEAYASSKYLKSAEKPKETEPAETKPQETEAPETTPTETRPAETKPEEGYQKVEETVSTTDVLHVRSGPGTDYQSLGKLPKGTKVRRTAVGDNGWSKIIYKEQEAFASSQYLKAEKAPEETKPQETEPPRDDASYSEVDETVYSIDSVFIRTGPGTDCESLGSLSFGDSLRRIGIGDNGWSQVVYDGKIGYVYSKYLTTEEPEIPDFGETTTPGFPTPNSPFIYQYLDLEDGIPYAVFEPVSTPADQPLPLIISLHGGAEVGENREFLETHFLTKELMNWEYSKLKPIDAYIVCPHLTGEGHPSSWNQKKSADLLFDVIEDVVENYNIDKDRIFLEGHSMGAQGALYMAADKRASFKAMVILDAYDPGVDISGIQIPVRGFSSDPLNSESGKNRYEYMKKIFNENFSKEYWTVKKVSHDNLPKTVFLEDANKDKHSDLIQWILAQ